MRALAGTWLLGAAGLIGLLLVWQGASTIGLLSQQIPSPWAAMRALGAMLIDGSALHHSAASLLRVLGGFTVGTSLAFVICCAFWLKPLLGALLHPTVELLRPIPPVALIPFAIFLLGLGDAPAIALVAFAAFFPMYVVVRASFDEAPRDRIEVAQTFGASRFALLRYVVVASAMPAVAAGLRTSAGIAWFVVIVAELVGAQSGLGYLIQESRLSFDLDRAMAAMILIAVCGVILRLVVDACIRLCGAHRGA